MRDRARLFYVPFTLSINGVVAILLGVFVRAVPRCNSARHVTRNGLIQLSLLVLITGTRLCALRAVRPVRDGMRHNLLLIDAGATCLSMICGLMMAAGLSTADLGFFGLVGFQMLAVGAHMAQGCYRVFLFFRHQRGSGESILRRVYKELDEMVFGLMRQGTLGDKDSRIDLVKPRHTNQEQVEGTTPAAQTRMVWNPLAFRNEELMHQLSGEHLKSKNISLTIQATSGCPENRSGHAERKSVWPRRDMVSLGFNESFDCTASKGKVRDTSKVRGESNVLLRSSYFFSS